MSITQALLGPLVASGSPRPLITHYDDAAGSRVELSRATVANWAAKTANWLVDEVDLEPGTPVSVALPAHWQTAGVLLGSWWCGAHVVDESAPAEVAFVRPNAASGAQARSVAAVALDALGAPLHDLPDGVLDYSSEIRIHGDDFTPLAPIPGSTPALLGHTVDEILGTARQRASDLGMTEGTRVLSTVDWTLPGGVIDGFLAVLAAQGSLVQCTHPDPAKLPGRRDAEHTTLTLGTTGE